MMRKRMKLVTALLLVLLTCVSGQQIDLSGSHVKNVLQQKNGGTALPPGADLVAMVNARLLQSSDVLIPPGVYNIACSTTWTTTGGFYNKAAIVLPTGAHLHGAGQGQTVINITRPSGLVAPNCAGIVNANQTGYGNNPGITIDNLTINWIETGCTTSVGCNYQTAAIGMTGADQLTIHHVTINGSPNKLISLIDTTQVDIHNNILHLNTPSSNNPGQVFGNGGLGTARFQSGVPYILNAGKIQANQISETGNPFNVSLVVLTQSEIDFSGNTVDLMSSVTVPSPGFTTGNTIEFGEDNLLGIGGLMRVCDNHFLGGGVRGPTVNVTFCGNVQDQGYGMLAAYAGTGPPTAAALSVIGNTYNCPGTGVQCGIFVNGNAAQGFPGVSIKGNIIHRGGLALSTTTSGASGSSYCVIEDNQLWDTPAASTSGVTATAGVLAALSAAGCNSIHGNLVMNWDADNFGIGNAGTYAYAFGDASSTVASFTEEVSGNRAIANYAQYNTGTVCSVSAPPSTTCLTSGTSSWLYSAGATWSTAWPNRYAYILATPVQVRAFYSPNYMELEAPVAFIPSGTSYTLGWLQNNGYYLGTNIGSFNDNFGWIGDQAGTYSYFKGYPAGGWITDVPGKTIGSISNNHFISLRQAVGGTNYKYYNQSPQVIGGITCTQANCSSSPVALYTMPNIAQGAGGVTGILFHYEANVACTAASSPTVSTAILELGYTDVSGTTQPVTGATATCTTLGNKSVSSMSGTFMMYGNSAATYKVTQTNSPNFQARVTIYQETSN